MEYIIKNQFLQAKILQKGAELRELVDSDGINRMHTPSDNTWNRVSPILFPQVSRIINSEYKVGGQVYKMTTHGFVRDAIFNVIKHTENEITLRYTSNEETLKMYPYEFILDVNYVLVANILEVNFKVTNPNDSKLLYMLGGHPGFRVPLLNGEKYSDYSLVFEKKEIANRMCLVDNFLANKYEKYKLEEPIVLNHSLFTNDALIFRNLESRYVDLISKNHSKKIRFHFSDFEILAIWSKVEEDAAFVCLEPWNGIQKDFVIDHEKMGVLEIEGNSFDVFGYIIEIL